MTKQDLSQIALKVLGIYALLQCTQFISGVINVFSFYGDAPYQRFMMALSMVVPFLILLWAGRVLILKTDRITSKYFPSGAIDNIALEGRQIQAIAFSIIGVVLIVTTIPKLSQLGVDIYSLINRADELQTKFQLERDTLGFGINLLIRLIIGVLLFVGGESISDLWRKIVNRLKYESKIG